MSGRFAAASDLTAFREAVFTGDSLLGPVPEGRFGWILPPHGAMSQPRGGFVADVDRFDAALFGVGNREAACMDPQSRLLLEACRAALEDAGHAPRSFAGRCVGVFIANTFQEWLHRLRQPGRVERIRLTDMTVCMLASRIARAFDLRGSAEVVNAACSGGLLAVHRACMALAAGECEAALAGGVSLILAGDGYVGEARAGMLSLKSESLAFDEAGNGFVRGEGVGVLLLKSLARARADRDVVHAVIRGSAAGHGGAAGGYDTDLAESQADAVARALQRSGVDPASIGYLELQAAGRPTDEAAELAVIAAGFRQATADNQVPQIAVGALKPLTGHMEAASGLGQLVKVATVLRDGIMPPIGGLSQPAEAVCAAWPGLKLPTTALPWPEQATPRRALISGYGFGGSHVHLVLEAAPDDCPATPQAAPNHQRRAFLLSAMTPALLAEAAKQLATVLGGPKPPSAEDIAFTLLVGRDAMPERLAILAEDIAGLNEQLSAFSETPNSRGAWHRGRAGGGMPLLGAAEEDRDWLSRLIQLGQWPKLAALWCGGLDIEWAALAYILPGRRISLPPMPLAATRFWLEDDTAPAAAPTGPLIRKSAPNSSEVRPADDKSRRMLFGQLAETLGVVDTASWADTDSPAALGLDSMAAAELRGRIAEYCGGVAPPLAQLLQAPDLRALLALMPPFAEGTEKALAVPDPAARHAPFPPTDIQFAYLIGRQEGQDYGGFGCQVYWEFDRPSFDVERLTQAWNHLVTRHDMLRVTFAPETTQRVLPADVAGPVEIALHDWSVDTDMAARNRAALAERFRTINFDPGQFPLFQVAVTRDSAGDRLHFALDLLLADGPSLFLLMEEWAALYDAPDTKLAPLSLSFRDYVIAQKQWEQGDRAAADFAYWQARLDHLPGPPALPVLPGVPPGRFRFLRHEQVLPLSAWRQFEQFSAAHGLTANAALIAAFAEGIAAWSQQPEFCLNVTLAGRRPIHPEVFQLVGDFTNNVLLAVPTRGERSFAEHAIALAAQLMTDIEHAGCSAVKVLGQLAHRRQTPISMPVVFTALNGYAALLKRPVRIDAIGAYHAGATRTPQVWLDAQSLEAADGLHLSWDAIEGIFAPNILADMFAGFVARVRRLAEMREAWSAPPFGTAPAPLRFANATATRLPWEPIFAGILRQAETAPRREAIIAQDRRIDFATLVREATMLAARIQSAGVARGQLVGVVMPKGWRQVLAVLAVGMAGAAYVPLELPLPPMRIQSLLRRAGVALALSYRAPEAVEWPCAAADLDTLLAEPHLPLRPCEPAVTDLAYVLFTSGSTGKPKGVAMQHGAVSNTLHDVNKHLEIGPEDRVLGVSSLGFDLSVWDIFGVLGAGGALVLPAAESVRDPAYLAMLVARERVTVWNSTPAYLKLVLEAPDITLAGSLRLFMLSGDWIPLQLARRLRAEYPTAQLMSLGGATEAAIWSIWHPVDRVEDDWRTVPYGRAMANQRFYVLDDAQRPCAIGEAGQLHIGGMGLAAGYWQDAAATAASFNRHPETGERLYRTGDYGRVLADGVIEFLGRRDAQVKIGGHRIELAEVEAGLQVVPGVLEAVAFPMTDVAGNQRLNAAYRHHNGLGEKQIRVALASSLPSYMVPSLLLPLERMPLTPNGKVDRKALADLALRRMSGASAVEQNATPATMPEASPKRDADPVANVAATVAAMLRTAGVISDKDERDRFVACAPATRRDLMALSSLVLPTPSDDRLPARISTRNFHRTPITQTQLSTLLAPLREVTSDHGPRRRYGSAGSSYAVQVYLLVDEQGVDKLPAGLWHYQPAHHRLVHLGPAKVRPESLHAPFNSTMAVTATVSLLLIGDLAAIRPLYGEMAEELLRIEAGSMSQLLGDAAAADGLGLCAIGWLDIAPLRAGLRLSPDHVFLHAMLGGQPASPAEPASLPNRLQGEAAIAVPPPTQDHCTLIRQVWEEVLEHADFADDSSFFEVGGNSFLAVKLQARLAQTLHPAPSVTDLFRYPTVLALADAFTGSDSTQSAPTPTVGPPPSTAGAPLVNVQSSDGLLANDPLAARRARRQAARRHLAPIHNGPTGRDMAVPL